MSKSNGIIIYEGPSLIDGKPIVAIATGFSRKSKNSKTGGGVIQTFILKQDMNPVNAYLSNKDGTICPKTCFVRRIKACYVNRFHAPWNVYRAYKQGNYPKLDWDNVSKLNGKVFRIGSFGDPSALPVDFWAKITKHVKSFVGYSHAYQLKKNNGLKKFCMASVESVANKRLANKLGWRTFRIRTPNQPVLPDEVVCPASIEKNHSTTCEKCGMCCGTTRKTKNVCIIAHGRRAKLFNKIMGLRAKKKNFMHLIK